ncbi:MAG: DnaJ domain-containing protein [Myxococcota bacterium]
MDAYTLLELEPGASEDEIKKAWRRLARQHHPDLNGGDPDAAERFKTIKAAYDALMAGDANAIRPSLAAARMDPDWLDALEWMIEVRRQQVMRDILPRFVGAYGTQSALVWALSRARNLETEAAALPAHPQQRVLRRLPIDILVDPSPGAWRLAAITRQRNGRVALILFANAIWRQRPDDEDTLRSMVFAAVDHGLAAAVPAALRRGPPPPTLELARFLDQRETLQIWFWRVVWTGIAGLAATMLWIMLTT